MLVINLNLVKNSDLSIWLYRLVRWTLSILFIWAGLMKLSDPQAFGVIIRDFGLVPDRSVMSIALILPAVEVSAALALIFDIRGSLAVISGLMILFMAILAYGIWLGLDIDCGCFGPEDPESRAYHGLRKALLRDLIMAAGILFLYWWRWRNSADYSASVQGSKSRKNFINGGSHDKR